MYNPMQSLLDAQEQQRDDFIAEFHDSLKSTSVTEDEFQSWSQHRITKALAISLALVKEDVDKECLGGEISQDTRNRMVDLIDDILAFNVVDAVENEDV